MSARVITTPFAALGDRYNIPDTDSDDSISISKGFTPIYSTPMSKGGKPPTREEFNGVFNLIFQHLYDRQVGLMPLYDNRLNYEVYCTVRSETGTTYTCIKENGPDTVYGVRNPVDNAEYWTGSSGSVEELSSNLAALKNTVDNHLRNNNNPHNVTKAQVGLSSVPNAVSSSIDLDDPNQLATAKAVHDLNEAIVKNLTGDAEGDLIIPDISKFIKIISKLEGHELSVDTEGKLLLDGNLVCTGTSGPTIDPERPLNNNQTSFLTINENNPNFQTAVDNMKLKDGSFFTVAEGATSPEYVKDDGIRATGFVDVPETNVNFDPTVEEQQFANGALFTIVEGEPMPVNDNITIDSNYTGYIVDADPGTPEFDEQVKALNLENGSMFTVSKPKQTS